MNYYYPKSNFRLCSLWTTHDGSVWLLRGHAMVQRHVRLPANNSFDRCPRCVSDPYLLQSDTMPPKCRSIVSLLSGNWGFRHQSKFSIYIFAIFFTVIFGLMDFDFQLKLRSLVRDLDLVDSVAWLFFAVGKHETVGKKYHRFKVVTKNLFCRCFSPLPSLFHSPSPAFPSTASGFLKPSQETVESNRVEFGRKRIIGVLRVRAQDMRLVAANISVEQNLRFEIILLDIFSEFYSEHVLTPKTPSSHDLL